MKTREVTGYTQLMNWDYTGCCFRWVTSNPRFLYDKGVTKTKNGKQLIKDLRSLNNGVKKPRIVKEYRGLF